MFKVLVLLTIVFQGDKPGVVHRFELSERRQFGYTAPCWERAAELAGELARYSKDRLAKASVTAVGRCERVLDGA